MMQEVLRVNAWDGKLGCKRFNPFSQVHYGTMLLTALRLHILEEIRDLFPRACRLCLDSNLNTLVDEVGHFHKLSFTKSTCCKRWCPYPNSTRVDCTLVSCDHEGPTLLPFLQHKNARERHNYYSRLSQDFTSGWRWVYLGATPWRPTSSSQLSRKISWWRSECI